MLRAIHSGSLPPDAVSQNPIPTTPPVAAIPARCSSRRLRLLSQTPLTPVCEATIRLVMGENVLRVLGEVLPEG